MDNRSRAVFAIILILIFALGQPLAHGQQPGPPSFPQLPPAAATPALKERILVGAYDAAQINGLVLITGNEQAPEQNLFGLRFLAYRRSGGFEESPKQFDFGPQAPDGSYARVNWRPQFDSKATITLRWSRIGNQIVVGQMTASADMRLAVEAYRPWSNERNGAAWASYAAQPDRRSILGEQIHNQKSKPPLRNFLLRMERAALVAANYNDDGALRPILAKDAQPDSPPGIESSGQPIGQTAGLRSVLAFDVGPTAPLGFVIAVGEDFGAMQAEVEKLMEKPTAALLDKAESDYEANRGLSGGALGESLEAINRASMWNRYYAAGQRYEYITMHRLAGRGLRGDALGWDSLLTSAMAAVTDGPTATASLRVLLAGQTPDGRIPLRRYLQTEPVGEPPVLAGRSMPPVGALCVLKAYLATQDLEFLAWAYPRLQRWNDWWLSSRGDGERWRDGNKDGLLEWGFDAELESGALGARSLTGDDKRRMALAESGFADRPQWLNSEKPGPDATGPTAATTSPSPVADDVKYNDQTHTLEFSPVSLNALYAADTELMVLISREIGLVTEADRWQMRYDEIKRLMNEKLWSEEDGLYLDRSWDGRFSRRLSLENFFPLIAGIPDEARAKRMLAVLRGMRKVGQGAEQAATPKFWGERLLPSIARDDPAFNNGAGQTAATGAVQAALNYLLYLGLKRYGFYDEAAELARSSTAMARAAYGNGADKPGAQAVERNLLPDLFSSVTGQPIEISPLPSRANFAGLLFLPGIEELISTDPWRGITIGSVLAPEEARVERVKIAGGSFDVLIGPKRTVVRREDRIEVEFEGPVRLRGYRSRDRSLTFTAETKEQIRVLVPSSEGRKVTVSVNDKVLGTTSPGAAASFKIKEGLSNVLIVR